MNQLIDPFGRTIEYLRISVTDRCDLRCSYCMSEDVEFLPRQDILSFEEILRLANSFAQLGVKKIRITGGEPLMRKKLPELIASINAIPGIEEVVMTTNGTLLTQYAKPLFEAGLSRLNISLDTLNAERFKKLTRRDRLQAVLDGIAEAKKYAFTSIKLNAVVMKGMNDDEIITLTDFAVANEIDITFIEVMPMGDIGNEDRVDQYLPLTEVRSILGEHWTLNESDHKTGGPARYVEVKETGGKIGFITPMTHNFCESCNRVRMTCTGTLYLCLGQDDAADLRAPLRSSDENGPLEQAIFEAIARKPKGHDFIIDRDADPSVARHMSVTGG